MGTNSIHPLKIATVGHARRVWELYFIPIFILIMQVEKYMTDFPFNYHSQRQSIYNKRRINDLNLP